MRVSLLSFAYRSSRFFITKLVYFFQKLLNNPRDLEPAVKIGDTVLPAFTVFGKYLYDFKMPSTDAVEFYDLTFPSPLVGSSFKSNTKLLDIWLRMGLGSIIFKTIMKEERSGNKRPRLQDASIDNEKGLLNSLGLPGPGIELFTRELPESKLWEFNRPLGISIGGDTIDEYINNIKQVDTVLKSRSLSYYYELNISCPNTINGQTICENPDDLDSLMKKTRSIISNPISVKVSPDVSDSILLSIGEVCVSNKKVFINAGNTQYKKSEEVGVNSLEFVMDGGGFSGPGIFNRTLEMVNVLSNFDIPIMATGGISSINDIKLLSNAGASLFGMATSLVLDPYCIPKINSEL